MGRFRIFRPPPPPPPSSVPVCPLYKQYICCWNGSTTSGGQVLVSILSTLERERKKKSIRVHLSCISHSIVALQWDLFSSGRFNTWAGQWKESNRVGWRGVGRGRRGAALWGRRAPRNCERAGGGGGWVLFKTSRPPLHRIPLLDVLEIIRLSEMRLFCPDKKNFF